MTDIVNNATIRVVADASGVEAGLRPAVDAAQRAGQAIAQTGPAAAGAARNVEAAQRRIVAAIEQTTIAMRAGSRASADFYEADARRRGVDPTSITPYLNQLRAVEAAQAQVAEATRAQASAQRELAQAQANKDSFLAGLREQIALFGKSTDEVLRYRAAQAGASQEAAMLILQLQNMRAAQEQVEAAARAAAQAQREAVQADNSRNNFIQGLREQIALFGLSTEEVHRYRAAQLGAATAADPLIAQLRDLRLAQEQAAYGARMEAQAQREAAAARAGRDSFLKGLEQQASSIGKTRVEMLELQAAQLGVTTQAKPFLDQLRAQEHAFREGGMSAAAMNAALRGVPAQITDIVVSLQGGQAPLTVLLQQGGQLRDMFGGAGAAAKALGGALLNLINPYTVTIAAIGTGVLAFKAGHDETIRYSRALALTGNISGTTSLQMADMARNIGEVSGSQRTAAAALTVLASTGAITRDNLEWFGTVAVDAQHVLGKSVEDTAKEFTELGKSPLTALQSIADKYHFVTAETYAQVKALQEQGRHLEAANVAQRAYAEGISGQRQKVLDSLSDWERGWLRIKKEVSGAVDAVIDFASGREEGDQQKIKARLEESEKIQERIARLQAAGRRRDGDRYDPSLDRDVLGAQAQFDALVREINGIRDKGKASKDAAAADAAGIRADELRNKWLDEKNILLSRQELLTRDLNAAEMEGRQNGLSDEEIQNRRLVIQRKYNDVFVEGIDRTITGLRRRAELEGVLDQRSLARIQSERDAGQISEDDALRRSASVQLGEFDRQKKLLQEQLALVRTKVNSQREQADIEGQIAVVSAQRTSRAVQLELDLAAAQRARAAESTALYLNGVLGATAERDSLLELLGTQLDYNAGVGLNKMELAEVNAARLEGAAALKDQSAAAIEALEPESALAAIYREQAQALRDRASAGLGGAAKDASKELKDFLDPTKAQTFGEALRNAFGAAGDSMTKLTGALKDYGARQVEVEKQRGAAAWAYLNGKKTEAEYQKDINALNEYSVRSQLAGYGDMTGAAAGFFDEQSRGYKALQTASQVFHAAELAMTLAELVPKGISAVLTQGQGDYYSAFARMAAMAAIVAGLGVAIGGIGSKSDTTAVDRQKANGTGSILGAPDAKSESVKNALDAIEKHTYQGLSINNSMLTVLRSIDSGINGVGDMLYRTDGFTTKVAGMQEGAVSQSFQKGILGEINKALSGGEWFGKALGKVGNTIFGGNVSTLDTGVQIDPASLAQILAGGINVSQYTDTKKDGGLFRSDKYSTSLTDLGAEIDSQFALVFGGMYEAITQSADVLGLGGDAFTQRLQSFQLEIAKISTKDMKPEDVQAALQNAISKAGDDMAKFAVAELAGFQKAGEGALETLTRIATEYQTVDVVMESIGKSFGMVGLASVGARERLIDLVGGLDEFTSSADQFLSDFYTDQERADSLRARITPTLDQFGIKTGAEDSLQQFRSVVTGLDLTTEAGARAYATLIQIAPAFKQIADVDAKALEDRAELANSAREIEIEIMELLGDKAGALAASRALELAGMDESLHPLQQRVYALQDEAAAMETANSLLDIQAKIYELTGDKAGAAAVLAQQQANALAALDPALRGATLQLWGLEAAAKATEQVKTDAAALMSGVDGAFSVLQKVLERQKKALQDEITVRTASIQKIEALSQSLRSTLDGMTVQGREAEDRQAAQAQIQAALAIAKASGTLPKADDLKNALSIVSKDSSALFATQEDYLRDFYATRIGIEDLAGITDKSLSAEERSLKSLEDQVKQYDLMLEREQEQIDVLKGISVTGLSIELALQALHSAVLAAGQNPVNAATAISGAYTGALGRAPDQAGLDFWKDKAASGVSLDTIVGAIKGSPEAQIQNLYKEVFGRAADASGLQFWVGQMNGGMSAATIREAMLGSDEKKLRGFAVGTNYLPATMPILAHEGERIIPAADNRELMRRLANPQQGSEVLAAAVDRLTATVARQEVIIANLQSAADKTQGNTKRVADGLQMVTNGWNQMRITEEVPA